MILIVLVVLITLLLLITLAILIVLSILVFLVGPICLGWPPLPGVWPPVCSFALQVWATGASLTGAAPAARGAGHGPPGMGLRAWASEHRTPWSAPASEELDDLDLAPVRGAGGRQRAAPAPGDVGGPRRARKRRARRQKKCARREAGGTRMLEAE